jgi:hypothetical protein
VTEQLLRLSRRGPLLRPFCQQAHVRPRSYSTLLERAITDFGAEGSFAQVNARLREHYSIEVAPSSARARTLAHAQQMIETAAPAVPAATAAVLLAEIDGSLIPLLDNEPPPTTTATAMDRRKHKRLYWKEARLSAAAPLGSRSPVYGATLGSTLEAGLVWEAVARRAGLNASSRVHGVGDGADWIAEQFDQHFGGQGCYLVDFYHVSEYLAAAAPTCAAADPAAWRQCQAQRLKTNQLEAVLTELAVHIEPEPLVRRARRQDEPSESPVRDCHRYLSNRRHHLDYAGALAVGWPIGSGLIEGGHRHVLQARLKRPGAWWKTDNARDMIALRVLRVNGDWDAYWQSRYHHNN